MPQQIGLVIGDGMRHRDAVVRPAVAVAVGMSAVADDFAVMPFVAIAFGNFDFSESQPPHNLAYCPGRAFVAVQQVRAFNQFSARLVALGQPLAVGT